MFKKAGRGFKKPFCINPACENFLPEEKRGYRKKTAEGAAETGEAAESDKKPAKKPAAKKTAAKKPAEQKKSAAKGTEA